MYRSLAECLEVFHVPIHQGVPNYRSLLQVVLHQTINITLIAAQNTPTRCAQSDKG